MKQQEKDLTKKDESCGKVQIGRRVICIFTVKLWINHGCKGAKSFFIAHIFNITYMIGKKLKWATKME